MAYAGSALGFRPCELLRARVEGAPQGASEGEQSAPPAVASTSGAGSSRLMARRGVAAARLKVDISTVKEHNGDGVSSEGALPSSYALHGVVGQGSMAVVHRASRGAGEKQVALKIARSMDKELRQAVREEYRALRRCAHQHIIGAIELIETVNRAIIVMELFEGSDLAAVCPTAALQSEGVCQRLFAQLLSAVAHVHDLNMIHRDIKPENVLVSPDFSLIKLIDFNTAKVREDSAPLTMAGTVLYAAPEVLQGDPPSFGGDVWGAGLCAYLMMTGELPQGRGGLPLASFPALRTCSLLPVDFTGHSRWESVSTECKAALGAAMELQPAHRPAARALEAAAWVGGRL